MAGRSRRSRMTTMGTADFGLVEGAKRKNGSVGSGAPNARRGHKVDAEYFDEEAKEKHAKKYKAMCKRCGVAHAPGKHLKHKQTNLEETTVMKKKVICKTCMAKHIPGHHLKHKTVTISGGRGQSPVSFHGGALHRQLGVPAGQKIPASKMAAAKAGKYGPLAAKRARFATGFLAAGRRTANSHRR